VPLSLIMMNEILEPHKPRRSCTPVFEHIYADFVWIGSAKEGRSLISCCIHGFILELKFDA